MKWIVITLNLFFALETLAQSGGDILKCLGVEEKRFHLKKDTGPIYELNQRLISEMIQIPSIQLRPQDYRTICVGKDFSESWNLLVLSIEQGESIFITPAEVQGMQKQIRQGMIEDYIEATREILLTFIAQIQTLSPTPNCLKEEIPQLDNFFTEIKYLQSDVDLKRIFKGKDKKIMNQLKYYPSAFDKCRARLKKKVKSESTKPEK